MPGGQTRKVYMHHEMAKISIKLWPKYFGKVKPMPADTLDIIGQMIDTISNKACKAGRIPKYHRADITQTNRFCKGKEPGYARPDKTIGGAQRARLYGWRSRRFHELARAI